jgi:hypothetical protein
MRYRSIAVVLFVMFPSLGLAAVPRPVDAWSDAAFTRARQRSALVREMVNELDASNVIVHIESSRLLPFGVGGVTRFVTSRGGYRYLRISLSIWLAPSDRVAILGHELQHAIELARSNVTDRHGVRRLFTGEDYFAVRGDEYFETRSALRVEREIRRELRRLELRTSRQALHPDQWHFPTGGISRPVALPDRWHFPTSGTSRPVALPD